MKKNCKSWLPALLLGAACGALAQDAQFDTTLSLGAWSGNRVLDDRSGVLATALAVDGRAALGEDVRVRANGTVYHFGQDRDSATRTALREALLEWDAGTTGVRAGMQILAWGRADRLNPTDNITARDYTAPFAVDEAQRIGAPALQVLQDFGDVGRVILIAKRFRPGRGPNDVSEQDLRLRAIDDKNEYAVKFDHSGAAVDWSVSYFDGVEKLRSLQLARGAGGRIAGVNRGYAPLQALGADAVATAGSWGLRGELARLRYPDNHFAMSDGRIDHWYGVAGVEKSLADSATVNVQYFFRRFDEAIVSSSLPAAEQAIRRQLRIGNNQFHRMEDGVSVRMAQRLWNDRVDYELVALANLREHDYAIRPRASLRYSDRIKLSIGGDVFRGRDESFFGSLRKNTAGFAQIDFIF